MPGRTIKEGELEKEKGKLLWSFDIATPGTKDITEIQVDALTGQVLNVSKEQDERHPTMKTVVMLPLAIAIACFVAGLVIVSCQVPKQTTRPTATAAGPERE